MTKSANLVGYKNFVDNSSSIYSVNVAPRSSFADSTTRLEFSGCFGGGNVEDTSIGGRNLKDIMQVKFHVDHNRTEEFKCTIEEATLSRVTCVILDEDRPTEAGIYHFTVYVAGTVSEQSVDELIFTGAEFPKPVLINATGCDAIGCPTAGNYPITITGRNLFPGTVTKL